MINTLEFIGRERQDLLEEIEKLRFKVWSRPFFDSIRSRLSIDSIDLDAIHVACISAGQLVGAGRISLHQGMSNLPDRDNFLPWLVEADFPAAFMNRLIVDLAHRNQGIAKRIDHTRLQHAINQGTTNTLFCEATGARIEALKALGFRTLGESPDRRYPGRWHIMQMKRTHFPPSVHE